MTPHPSRFSSLRSAVPPSPTGEGSQPPCLVAGWQERNHNFGVIFLYRKMLENIRGIKNTPRKLRITTVFTLPRGRVSPEPSPVGEGGPPQRWMRCHPIYTVLGLFKLKFEYHLTHNFLFINQTPQQRSSFDLCYPQSGSDICVRRLCVKQQFIGVIKLW